MNKNSISIKKVLMNSGLYSITSIMQRALSFFLLPLYTLYLTPADYGIISLINSLTGVLTLFFTLSLGAAVSRFYYEYKENEDKLRSFWGTIVIFVITNSIVMGLILILLKDVILMPFVKGIGFYPYIFIAILTVIVTPLYTIYQNILQIKQEAKHYSINSTLYFVVMIFLNIAFIVIFKLGALGQLLSYLFTGFVFSVYSIYILKKRNLISFTFNSHYLVQSLKYSVPLLPHVMSGNIANFISRIFLNNIVSTANLGLFNVGSQFILVISTFQEAVNSAYVPWFYGTMSKGEVEHKKIITFVDFLLRVNCIISLFVALFIKEIIQIMTPNIYLLAWSVVPIMLIAYQIHSIYLCYVNTLFYNKGATRYIFLASITGNIVSIVFSALLTAKLGIMTPAIVLIIQKLITTGITIILSNKYEKVNFKFRRMIAYVIILMVGSYIGLIYDIHYPTANMNVANILYKLLIFLIVCFLLINKDYKFIRDNINILFKKKTNK